jgi:hypothetical protein
MKQFTDDALERYVNHFWDRKPIDVDDENFEIVRSEEFHNGRLVLFYIGGDWQWPVYFAAVLMAETYFIYLPENGNIYSKEYMAAFEPDCDEDDPLYLENADYDIDGMLEESKVYFSKLVSEELPEAVLWLSLNAPDWVLDYVEGLL